LRANNIAALHLVGSLLLLVGLVLLVVGNGERGRAKACCSRSCSA
jgi:hypothetical protein